ncbi:MAG: hypothetical protein JW904_09305 [Spirochaetales bacterium]|nr:hypothetical protein [Spirochaetales bacterium]
MKRLLAGFVFVLGVHAVLFAQENAEQIEAVPVFQMRLVVEKNTPKAEPFLQKGTGEEIWLASEIVLEDSDIVSIKKDRDRRTRQPIILINFSDAGAVKLFDFTAAHIGDSAALIINGELVVVAKIVDTIPGGKLQVTGNFTNEEVTAIVSLFNDHKKRLLIDIFK